MNVEILTTLMVELKAIDDKIKEVEKECKEKIKNLRREQQILRHKYCCEYTTVYCLVNLGYTYCCRGCGVELNYEDLKRLSISDDQINLTY